jgi:hypothetical protein
VGYIVAGVTRGSLLASFAAALVTLVAVVCALHFWHGSKAKAA